MRRFRSRATSDALTCRRTSSILQAYIDGELDDVSTRRIVAHLEICRRCGLEAEVFAQIKASLAHRSRSQLDEVAYRRLRAFTEDLAAPIIAGEQDEASPEQSCGG